MKPESEKSRYLEEDELLWVDMEKELKEFRLKVQFSCRRERVGILGPSGSGKSMTLKSIAGIVSPDSGRILLRMPGNQGEKPRTAELFSREKKINLKPQRRRVGYLFLNYALFPNMTVEENIQAGLGKKGDQKLLADFIRRFRLEGLQKRYPSQLSGGQQQRTALARILANQPAALLLDEPFSALDGYLREELRMELSSALRDFEGPVVLVTHDREEAYQLCSRLVLMDKGKVLAEGPAREVFSRPKTCQAARLTGCRNISRIRRISPWKVEALDWNGLVLETAEKAGGDVKAVGIRTQDLTPVSDGLGVNRIPVKHPRMEEMPFSWQICLENGIWWEMKKQGWRGPETLELPEWLYVDPAAVLLLQGE